MRTIAVINRKGGSGKTTTAVNTAAALAEMQLPVLVVEYVADPAKRALVQQRLAPLGYVVHFARKDLDLPPQVPDALADAPVAARVRGTPNAG